MVLTVPLKMPKNRIRVYARFKPTDNFPHDLLSISKDGTNITIKSRKDDNSYLKNSPEHFKFTVDGTLLNAPQEEVYSKMVEKMTEKAMDGFNCTLLAYGQTGAGKTYTISGATENYKLRGIIPRVLSKIFKQVEEHSDRSYKIQISYMEIYNESAYDLLATLPDAEFTEAPINKKYILRTNNTTKGGNLTFIDDVDGHVFIKGLSRHTAKCEGDCLNLFFEGETNRSIAAHSLNKNSSRSHCIFTVHIESRSRSESNAKYISSKFNLVDLAGSERLNKTHSVGQTKIEALYINKSLSYLEQTVAAMAEKFRTHVPYRQTKLTHALKDSLGGKCPTILICNVYPDADYLDETIATLRFGARMMRIPVEAQPNELCDPLAQVNELSEQVKALKLELSMHDSIANRNSLEYEPLSEHQIVDIKTQVRNFLDGKASDVDVQSMRHLQQIFRQFRKVASEMEKDMMASIRSQYFLIDRSDADTIGMLQKQFGVNLDEYDTTGSDGGNLNVIGGNQSPDGVLRGSNAGGNNNKKQAQGVGREQASKKNRDRKSEKRKTGNSKPQNAGSTASVPDMNQPLNKNRRDTILESQAQGAQVKRGSADPRDMFLGAPTGGGIKEQGGGGKDQQGSMGSNESIEIDVNNKPSRPGTPPNRGEAYEEFKKERGQEIARILNENKTILQSKKREVRDLAHAVNTSKHMIDGAKIALDRKRQDRFEQGEFVNEEGEMVIDEEEYELISQLNSLKKSYRKDFNELKNAKAEVEYCDKLVRQCRERLVREFDNWYNEMFLQDGEINGNAPNVLTAPAELYVVDENERFEQLQQDSIESKQAAIFNQAKLRTRRRKMLEKTYRQAQPSKNMPIGIPRVTVKNRPPNEMSTY